VGGVIHNTPQEHRPTANDRRIAEDKLETLGWTLVRIPKERQQALAFNFVHVMKWCEDNTGPGRVEIEPSKIDANDQWYSFSWYGYWDFWFRQETDATAFTLRWA
jgi:hypothetical protein